MPKVLSVRDFGGANLAGDNITSWLTSLNVQDGTRAASLAYQSVQLARCLDRATARGSATAAAMASRELRETTLALVEQLEADQPAVEDPFDALVRQAGGLEWP